MGGHSLPPAQTAHAGPTYPSQSIGKLTLSLARKEVGFGADFEAKRRRRLTSPIQIFYATRVLGRLVCCVGPRPVSDFL